jgi:two-component system response regulator
MSITGNGVVLLVEDDPEDVALTRHALKWLLDEGRLVVARDGVAALDYLLAAGAHEADPPALPALVLLDIKLPRLDGLDVLREIRAHDRSRHVPVVVLTSSLERRDLCASFDLGANSYVHKPIDFDEFGDLARVLVTYWLQVNRAPDPA